MYGRILDIHKYDNFERLSFAVIITNQTPLNLDKLKRIKEKLYDLINEANTLIEEKNTSQIVIISKSQMNKVKKITEVNTYIDLYEFDNFARFQVRNVSGKAPQDDAERDFRKKLLSDELDYIILKKYDEFGPIEYNQANYHHINYEFSLKGLEALYKD